MWSTDQRDEKFDICTEANVAITMQSGKEAFARKTRDSDSLLWIYSYFGTSRDVTPEPFAYRNTRPWVVKCEQIGNAC